MAPNRRQITLKDVNASLSANSTLPYNRMIRDLLNIPTNGPLKCTPRTAERFGSVMVTLTRHTPLRPSWLAVSTPDRVRDILLDELATHKRRDPSAELCCPGINDPNELVSDEKVAVHLINQLENPAFTAPHQIPNLPSPRLNAASHFAEDCACPFPAVQTLSSTSVLPSGAPVPLHHQNESRAYSTLLVGSIVWIIWPPTSENLDVLRSAYYSCSANSSTKTAIFEESAKRLRGGVTFVHNVGEVVRIPPYCIVLGQAMEMSALCTYTVVDASRIPQTLKMIPFMWSWWELVGANVEERTRFGSALLDIVQKILDCEYEAFEREEYGMVGASRRQGVLSDLLEVWNEIIKDFLGILTQERAYDLKEMIKEFLQKAGGVATTCAICHVRTGLGTGLDHHFDMEHWGGAAEIVEQAVSGPLAATWPFS